MIPDFSPAVLKAFLHIRVGHEANISFPSPRGTAERVAKRNIRRAAGVSDQIFKAAWKGHLGEADARTRIWAALGIVPALSAVRLLDKGEQEAIDAP